MAEATLPRELIDLIRKSGKILLSSHANPDGDAIGSEVAFARLLRTLGKSVTIWNADPTPTVYSHLPGTRSIHVGQEPPQGFPEDFDLVIPLECPTLDRTGLEDHLDGCTLVNIDHHLGNGLYGVVNWVDTESPSVGAMIFRLAQEMKIQLDEGTANCLYLTLVTDTGNFRFSNATPVAFDAASELVQLGASPEQVSKWLYESQPLGALRLLGEVLQTLELHDNGRVATVLLTQEMYEKSGATRQDSEGLIDHPRSIAGVEVVALLRELEDGAIKASLRSRGDVSVESVARRHNGGGHRNAAGCTFEGDLNAARQQLATELAELLPKEP